jgi:hypothetical protein
MIVFCLGTPSSASTWIFNVARDLLEEHYPNSASIFASTAETLLRNTPMSIKNAVVKSHNIDRPLLTIMNLSECLVIISLRDPRDCVVSMTQRFNYSFLEATRLIVRSLASIAMLKSSDSRNVFVYEDMFTEKLETIERIANLMGVKLDIDFMNKIFDKYNHLSITSHIGQQPGTSSNLSDPLTYDVETHWHPRHIGDRRIGKWVDQLSAAQARAVANCALPLSIGSDWQTTTIHWDPSLFSASTPLLIENVTALVTLPGHADCVVYGPHLFLPTGKWRAIFLLEPTQHLSTPNVQIDIVLHNPTPWVITLSTTTCRKGGKPATLEFDHFDQSLPIEARVNSIADNQPTTVRFGGVELQWLGPTEYEPASEWRRIQRLSQFVGSQ